MPLISVIRPTFNRLQFLTPAIDSLFAQIFTDWELIIADDGSDANTRTPCSRSMICGTHTPGLR
jgi:glycosyltransferase involved in cell wall biosynthesis